jgi:Xaa-Pro aminopeptidase
MNDVRLGLIREAMASGAGTGSPLGAMLIASPHNRTYMTGFTGSSGYVLLAPDKAFLLTDFRYVEQAASQAPLFQVVKHGAPYLTTLADIIVDLDVCRLGIEAEHTTVAEHDRLAEALAGVTLCATAGLVEAMRLCKDDAEIHRLEAAVECSDAAFAKVLADGVIRAGVTELTVAAAIEAAMRAGGSTRPSFDTIVASGPRSSLPHGRASERVIGEGEFVTMDFGATVDGYCSDITRTVVVGRASAEQREVYDLVHRAQLAGLAAVRAGISGKEPDAAARDIIAAAGHGDHFGHGLGHGVGLQIHEGPRLSPASESLLRPGMVTSVEPGVYVPGWGGVRIEDLVVVTDTGCRVLTRSPKELIEVR